MGHPPKPAKKPKKQSASSHLQAKLVAAIKAAGLPPVQTELKFHPVRKWRMDVSFLDYQLSIEVQGGTYSHGRHSRGPQMHNDYDKLNAAQLLGWRVLYFDTKHIKDIDTTVETIRQMLKVLGWEG